MMGKNVIIIAILAAVVIASAAVLVIMSPNEKTEPSSPDTPDVPDPEIPDPEPVYPKGISFDPETGTLSHEDEVTWYITDELVAYVDKKTETVIDKTVVLDEGLYSVKVGDDSFNVVVPGKKSITLKWDYQFNDQKYPIEVTYDVDIAELSEITLSNRDWNNGRNNDLFMNLPKQVYVNDTVRSIVSQLKAAYIEIGGSMDDRQSYADILASFAQLGIEYPPWETIPKTKIQSSDYHYWGKDEYWANTLETLYFGKGDCEDSSAVACALFIAAGFKTAMVGGPGHVMSSVSLDSFEERDTPKYGVIMTSFDVAVSTSARYVSDPTVTYYGVETIKGQTPVGYLMKGQLKYINADSDTAARRPQGLSGYYSVDQGEVEGIH